jgi:predicted transcriptional regulator
MGRPSSTRPTDAELAILRVLWGRGPSTVREVHAELGRTLPPGYERPSGYTSVLKVMQIMTGKGLVERDESRRTHVYRPALSREQTQRQLVGDLLDRAFGGSARALILQALSARRSSPDELAQIRELIDEAQAKQADADQVRANPAPKAPPRPSDRPKPEASYEPASTRPRDPR